MKLLFTDLDDTLLNRESRVSAKTQAFLKDFIASGNRLILSSGRPLNSILEVKEQAGLFYPGILIIAFNGALVYDCDSRRPLLEKRMPLSYVSYLQNAARSQGLHIQTYTDDSIVCTEKDAELDYYRRRIHLPCLIAADYASFLPQGPYKMLAIHLTDHKRLTDFRNSISGWTADKLQTIFSNENYLELFVKDAGKGNALRFVCEHFQVPVSDSYAAGDADNDISMLEAAGCGIAMKNAAPEVKKAADAITLGDNDNDGLAEFMRSVLS